MKKIYRILKNEEFKTVLNNHKCVSRENVKIFYKENEYRHIRVGISVSSKIGNSVVRHKVKRQITDIVDKNIDFENSLDIVIIAKNEFLNKTYTENCENLIIGLNKILRKDLKKDEK